MCSSTGRSITGRTGARRPTSARWAVTAMRTLYRARPGERAVAAVERKVGIVEGYWTPHAARQGAMLTAHLVPREAEEVLGVLGNMTPSKSSLDRLPKALSARWEAQRPPFEARVREATLDVPDTARTVAVSLDGVMAPMKTGGGGYREASCASVSLYDGEGERLSTVRMARMPESKKVTLKTMVAAEVEAVLGQRPDLQLVKIADGAKDNWTFLSQALPAGVELIDFYHAVEHLKDAFDAPPTGANDPKADGAVQEVSPSAAPRAYNGVNRRSFGRCSICARSHPGRASESHRCWATSAAIATAWATPMPRTRDCPSAPASWRRRARLLVTERLKRSGMRWSEPGGGQAILTLRSLAPKPPLRVRDGLVVAIISNAEVSCP